MLEIMCNLVQDLRRRSTCQRRQQACVITDREYHNIYAIGYNGKAKGEKHQCDTLLSGQCGCVHAETNALVKLGVSPDNLVLLCTMSPCVLCARLIVNNGKIWRFIYFEEYRDTAGLEILKNAGIEAQCTN